MRRARAGLVMLGTAGLLGACSLVTSFDDLTGATASIGVSYENATTPALTSAFDNVELAY